MRLKRKRLKLRVSESRGKVYFYYAERKQVQAHEVWLKLVLASENQACLSFYNERSQGSSTRSVVKEQRKSPLPVTDKGDFKFMFASGKRSLFI